MSVTTITATFDTRRDAELAVEHLVQEHDIDRDDIVIGPDGDDNSVGLEPSGSDEPTIGEESDEDDAALNGAITVSVTLSDDKDVDTIQDVLLEYGGSEIADAD
jgi:hypothetical protein